VLAGHRLTEEEAVRLLMIRDRGVLDIAAAADEIRERMVGETVTYVRNQNINVTNLCVNACGFCGSPGSRATQTRISMTRSPSGRRPGRRVSGVSPRSARSAASTRTSTPNPTSISYPGYGTRRPGVHIHASNPMEVAYAAQRSGISTREVLIGMKAAGLGTLCGTAAEILVDSVRAVICPGKVDTATWVRIIREAPRPRHPLDGDDHVRPLRVGGGPGPAPRDPQGDPGRYRGVHRVRAPLVRPRKHPLYRAGRARPGATGREDILMVAVARLFLDNIENIQASWVKLGRKMAEITLLSGANDLGGDDV